jgi:hypothetical protein
VITRSPMMAGQLLQLPRLPTLQSGKSSPSGTTKVRSRSDLTRFGSCTLHLKGTRGCVCNETISSNIDDGRQKVGGQNSN